MYAKEVLKIIGAKNWDKFSNWMMGQTMGMYPDGSWNYYSHDVKAFKAILDGKADRQKNPLTWD